MQYDVTYDLQTHLKSSHFNPDNNSPRQHSVQQHPEAPDVNGRIVPLLLQHFWGNKVGRVARRHQQTILCPELLGKAKVGNPQCFVRTLGLGVEDVGRLQVSVHYTLLVKKLYS